MQRTNRIPQPIEFKGTTLPVVIVTLRSLQADELARAATTLFGGNDFFDGEAAVLDLAQLVDVPEPDWRRLKQLFKSHGLNVIGVRGGSEELRYGAAFAGLPTYAVNDRPTAAGTAARAAAAVPPATAEVAEAPPVDPTPPPAPTVTRTPTLFVNRPLRSGQQVYARGGDLVVLAAVNAGAEVIADGSIHIYAPLRGRALAGASGATEARILCTRFDAELVSVAGLYRTFDGGVAHELAGRPVQVRLLASADLEANQLIVEALSTD